MQPPLGATVAQRPLFDPSRIRAAQDQSTVQPPTRLLSVSQVTALVRTALAANLPTTLHVVAEIGDLSRPASGHLYFTLKDARSELRCVMWKSAAARLRFEPRTGLEVIAAGQIEVYEPRGAYQLMVRTLEPRGAGALELAFRQLRDKLEAQGLFSPNRKRQLPRFPFRIALVTSPAGAALRDILRTLARRFPVGHVVLFPARVQGDGAAQELAEQLRAANRFAPRFGGIDLIILARGGGSLEDLWAFNEEIVAHAIADSAIPVVSGVGHEVDVTISDLVADLRAPTPTAAAELATPLLNDVLAALQTAAQRTTRAAALAFERAARRFDRALAADLVAQPMRRTAHARQRLDDALRNLDRAARDAARDRRDRLRNLESACRRLAGPERLVSLHRRLDSTLAAVRWSAARRLLHAQRRLSARSDSIQRARPDTAYAAAHARLERIAVRLAAALASRAVHARRVLDLHAARLAACDPRGILRRGYAIVREPRTSRVLKSVRDVRDGMPIEVELADGRFTADAADPRQPRLLP